MNIVDKNTEIKTVTVAFVCTKCDKSKTVGFLETSFMLGYLSKKISSHRCYKCTAKLDIVHIKFECVKGLL